MTRSANIFFGLFTAGTLIAVAIVQPADANPREQAIKDYRQWTLVTPQAVYMEPWVSTLCLPDPLRNHPNPHVPTYFKVFVNERGKEAMKSKDYLKFPVGSVLVKEKFEPTIPFEEEWLSEKPGSGKPKSFDKPNLLTVMIKRDKGYDAPNGDWEYFAADGEGKANSTDLPVSHCQSCHLKVKTKDYTFRIYDAGTRISDVDFKDMLLQYPQRRR